VGVRTKALVVGLAVSTVLVAIVVARIDWREFVVALEAVRWGWVSVGCVGVVLTITIRALRWAAVSGASLPQTGLYWNATVIGYLGNVLYPGRAGELLRIAALHRALPQPPGELLAKAFVDRLGDVVLLGVAALYVLGVLATHLSGDTSLAWLLAAILAPVALFVALLALGARLKPLVSVVSNALPGHWKERIPRWYAQLFEACGQLARPTRLANVLVFTLAAYCADYAVFWLFLQAFEWAIPLRAAVTVGVLVAIGSMLPSAPGNVGVYQIACVLALRPYGVGESSALAYSVVAQGATLLMIGALGVVVAARYGLKGGLSRKRASS
jgi:glycosyltransferase 2 family protein